MINIAVIYYSGFGHTKEQALAVCKGVESIKKVNVFSYSVEELTDDLSELENMDACIFGSPTYMGSVAAPFKKFMDNTSRIWAQRRWEDKIAAGFTNSHSFCGDKLNTLMQMIVFAMQHGMVWVGQAEMNKSIMHENGSPKSVNRLGSFLGAMAQSENDDPSLTPPSGDLLTARKLGERVAKMALRLKG